MSIVPPNLSEKIEFFESHIAPWTDNAAAIGLTPGQVTGITAMTAAARAAYNDAIAQREAAKNATLAQKLAVDMMGSFGGDLIKTIRAFAETNNNPTVYTLASIPEPATPTPLGPPATPEDVTVGLTTAGSVTLAWKGSRQGGTSFNIQRRTQTPGNTFTAWTLIGTSEEKSFEDANLPVGLASAQYRVTAVRSAGASQPSTPVSLLLGTAEQQAAAVAAGLRMAA
jgi:hypothetical protein